MRYFVTKHRNKYNNRKTIVGGVKYDSKVEGNYANDLFLMEKAKEIKSWYPKPKFDLIVEGVKIAGIIPDFWVEMPDGSIEIHEVKSYITQTREWQIKWRLLQVLYPEYTYRVILN